MGTNVFKIGLPRIICSSHINESHQKFKNLLLENVGDEFLILSKRSQKPKNKDLKKCEQG